MTKYILLVYEEYLYICIWIYIFEMWTYYIFLKVKILNDWRYSTDKEYFYILEEYKSWRYLLLVRNRRIKLSLSTKELIAQMSHFASLQTKINNTVYERVYIIVRWYLDKIYTYKYLLCGYFWTLARFKFALF